MKWNGMVNRAIRMFNNDEIRYIRIVEREPAGSKVKEEGLRQILYLTDPLSLNKTT